MSYCMFLKYLFNIYLENSLKDAVGKESERASPLAENALSSVVLTYSICSLIFVPRSATFVFYFFLIEKQGELDV